MNPSFFGPPGEQLLGVHHPPRAGARGLGVVLCPAAPLEAVRSHWAFRKLAEQLAKRTHVEERTVAEKGGLFSSIKRLLGGG